VLDTRNLNSTYEVKLMGFSFLVGREMDLMEHGRWLLFGRDSSWCLVHLSFLRNVCV
jgi:hypothetical protein